MGRGGRLLYNGSIGMEAATLQAHFERIPGVQRISPGSNPATWVLQCTSQQEEERLGVDFAAVYAESASRCSDFQTKLHKI